MIRKLLMSSVALVVISGTAFAADLPSRRAPPVFAPPPLPVFSWTGFYVGAQVGYAFGTNNAGIVATGPYHDKPNGIIGGAHVGYNYTMASTPFFGGFGNGIVVGLEGDVDGSDYRRSTPLAGPNTANIRANIQGSARGRIGVAVDRALFYATGGAAFADFHDNYTTFLGGNDSLSHTRVGWTVGGGVEYALNNNWSLRAEYRYSDFGSFTDVSPAFFSAVRHHETQNRVQAGVSYKFDTLVPVAPVVARY